MPAQEGSHRKQKAILWEKTGIDAYGQPKVAAVPVEIMVRWNTNRRNVLMPDGNTIALEGDAVVDQVIESGSRMWLGALRDWYGTGSSSGNSDEELMEVVAYKDTPDVKARHSFKQVTLKWFRDRK